MKAYLFLFFFMVFEAIKAPQKMEDHLRAETDCHSSHQHDSCHGPISGKLNSLTVNGPAWEGGGGENE